jgi:predicted DNA-binding WGR domain protein
VVAIVKDFIFTEVGDTSNNNKVYKYTYDEDANGNIVGDVLCEWGRMGGHMSSMRKSFNKHSLATELRNRVDKKGYTEVKRAVLTQTPVNAPSVAVPSVAEIARLWAWMNEEANQSIASYLKVSTSDLSLEQVRAGKAKLRETYALYKTPGYDRQALVRLINEFFRTIPTKLPAKPTSDFIIRYVCEDFQKQEDNLDQLEAQVLSLTSQPATSAAPAANTPLAKFEPRVALVDRLAPEFATVQQWFSQNRGTQSNLDLTLDSLYRIHIPGEREKFEANTFGAHNKVNLVHGSAGKNLFHILMNEGLICPQYPSSGRMFGDGIYFGKPDKSVNYTGNARQTTPSWLFLCMVALGDPKVYQGSQSHLKRAEAGYHSSHGKAGYTNTYGQQTLMRDEWIVYLREQQTVQYVATFQKKFNRY